MNTREPGSPPPSSSKRLRFWLSWLIPIILLVAGSLAIRWTEADQNYCRAVYNQETGEWILHGQQPWTTLYHFGTIPGLVLAFVALVGLILSFINEKWSKFQLASWYLLLLLAIGPGLISNALLKDHWGRPRPRMVDEFGGSFPFEAILAFDPVSDGKSFPCGHATMGYFFFAGFFLFYRTRQKVAWAFAFFGLALGSVIGWARMAEGGHFLSDVLWAAGIMWLTALGLSQILRIPERAFLSLPPRTSKRPRWVIPVATVAGLLVLFLASLATPYEEKMEWKAAYAKGESATSIVVQLKPVDGRFIVSDGDGEGVTIRKDAKGHGLPGSALKERFREKSMENSDWLIAWEQRKSGLFTEIEATTSATIATTKPIKITITTEGPGPLDLHLKPDNVRQTWQVTAPGRLVTVWLPRSLIPAASGESSAKVLKPPFSLTIDAPGGQIMWKEIDGNH